MDWEILLVDITLVHKCIDTIADTYTNRRCMVKMNVNKYMNKYNDQKPTMVSHFRSYGKNVKNKIMKIYQCDINY